ncbi:MAG: hypothetical protein ACTSW1_08390 [Candidatus Hodarchaeales archaeon]
MNSSKIILIMIGAILGIIFIPGAMALFVAAAVLIIVFAPLLMFLVCVFLLIKKATKK